MKERRPVNLRMDVMFGAAIESIVYDNGQIAINPPVCLVNNDNLTNISLIRKIVLEQAKALNIPFFYHNYDLETQVLRIKKQNSNLKPKN